MHIPRGGKDREEYATPGNFSKLVEEMSNTHATLGSPSSVSRGKKQVKGGKEIRGKREKKITIPVTEGKYTAGGSLSCQNFMNRIRATKREKRG